MRALKFVAFLVLAFVVSARPGIARTDSLKPRKLSEEEARALAIYAPKPPYPYYVRAKGMTGTGVVIVTVDPSTGVVTAAQLERSIGHKLLDDISLAIFRRWRFKPGTVSKVRIPITFTLGPFHVYVRALGDSSWLRSVTNWSLPAYPYDAIHSGLTGSGQARLKINSRTGSVTSVSMLKSTGHAILDDAAIGAFLQWRFRPRTLAEVEIPIEFSSRDTATH